MSAIIATDREVSFGPFVIASSRDVDLDAMYANHSIFFLASLANFFLCRPYRIGLKHFFEPHCDQDDIVPSLLIRSALKLNVNCSSLTISK